MPLTVRYETAPFHYKTKWKLSSYPDGSPSGEDSFLKCHGQASPHGHTFACATRSVCTAAAAWDRTPSRFGAVYQGASPLREAQGTELAAGAADWETDTP